MPKPVADSVLTARVVPTLNRREPQLEAVRQDIINGANLWDVNIVEFNERQVVQPGSDFPAELDPYIEVDFTVLQAGNGQLTIVKWSISGSELISTSKSRVPLQAYARAALLAVEDALELNAERDYAQMTIERRAHRSAFEMHDGRLLDPTTREQRKPPRRLRLVPTSERPGLELARVVDEYRRAVERGSRSPTVDVARAFHVGRSTASRAIAEARKQGLLGPARHNAAGELP